MAPDLTIQTRKAWLALLGTCVVTLAVVGYFWSDASALEDKVEAAAQAKDQGIRPGKELLEKRLADQRAATAKLLLNLDKLKKEVGLELAPFFVLPKDLPGYEFKKKWEHVTSEIREQAEERRIPFNEDLGFDTKEQVPPDSDAQYLVTMLQLTRKVAMIAANTPSPLERFEITHGPARNTGPETRPTLLREYPLKVTVRGSVKDILWMLYSFSVVNQSQDPKVGKDFPLILCACDIESSNNKPRDSIAMIDAVFDVAGLEFLSDEERSQEKAPLMHGKADFIGMSSHGAGTAPMLGHAP